ncbi:MAG: flavin monoamine oxidase family protein [Nitrososphaerota archaeon]
MNKRIMFVIVSIFVASPLISSYALAQEFSIPTWIKNNAGWWADGKIGDSDFVSGIKYLIEHKIMIIPETKQVTKSSEEIPSWIKNNAKWWAEGSIGDSDFVNGIQYLIQQGIMVIDVEDNQFDVIVIGAGISGIAAADFLDEKGYDVVILEARDRIGGRIFTDRSLNGIPLDMEASWIHGIEGNPIMELAKKYGIETVPTDYESSTTYDADGNEIDEKREKEIWNRFYRFEDIFDDELLDLDDDASLQEAVDYFIKKENLSGEALNEFLYTVNVSIEHEYAGDVSDMSYYEFDEDLVFPGEDVLFPGGYDQIITVLSDGLDIRLNHVVTKIDYGGTNVKVSTIDDTFIGKIALCTVPLGVLEKGSIEFSPPLPQRKLTAIENLEMGVLNKVYLQFPEVFWEKDTELIGYIGKEKGHWAEFYNMYYYIDEPILLGFNAAEYGREVEKFSDKEIIADVMTVLKTIYGDDIPQPTGYLITRWGSDEFSGGSYSYVGVDGTANDHEILAEPLAKKLFFAGEATSKSYAGTVHGAYLSGIREAHRIFPLLR